MKPWESVQRRVTEHRELRLAADWANSPEGRATAARERGDAVLQIEAGIGEFNDVEDADGPTAGPTDLIGRVEALGWCLDRVGYVSTGGDGMVHGIYLFRNAEIASPIAFARPRPRPA